MRGYGPVKAQAMADAATRWRALEAEWAAIVTTLLAALPQGEP